MRTVNASSFDAYFDNKHGFYFSEALTPLVVETQKQFNFSHILAGASAAGKVCLTGKLL